MNINWKVQQTLPKYEMLGDLTPGMVFRMPGNIDGGSLWQVAQTNGAGVPSRYGSQLVITLRNGSTTFKSNNTEIVRVEGEYVVYDKGVG